MKLKNQLLLLISILFCGAVTTINAQQPNFELVGYAAMNGGTTGGEGGEIYYASNYSSAGYNNPGEFIYQLLRGHRETQKTQPNAGIIVMIDTKITESNFNRSKLEVKDISNVSIIGVDDKGEFDGVGWTVSRANNVIFRNLSIHHVRQGEGTCIEITESSHNIWVDRNEFYADSPSVNPDKNYYDGLVDIKRNAQLITVSWNVFRDHWKGCLLGHTDNASLAPNFVTYHHNLFMNVNSRLPLIRYATTHLFNNYFLNIPSSAINCRNGAQVRVERNYFENCGSGTVDTHAGYVQGPVGWWYGSPEGGGWHVIDNITVNSPTDHMQSTTTTSVPYNYAHVMHNTSDVPSVIMQYAGRGGGTVAPPPTQPQTYSLSANVSGQGTVNPSSGSYDAGTNVSISATAASGWEFNNWSGSASGSQNPLTINMDGNKNLTANFVQSSQTPPPTGGGSTVADGGIYVITARHSGKVVDVDDCKTGAGSLLQQNSWEDLACQKWEFVDAGNGYWHLIPNHTSGMMARARGTSSGSTISLNSASTSSNDRQWSLTEVGDGFYQLRPRNNTNLCLTVTGNSTNDNVELTVATCNSSAQNQQFSFSGEGGTEPPVVTYNLTTQVNGQGSVSPVSGTFNEGSQVTVSATSADGWQFDNWSGSNNGSNSTITITMDGNKSLTANFSEIPPAVSSLIIQENEDGFCDVVTGKIENNHSGFTGTGFTNPDNATGTYIEWAVIAQNAGTFQLKWRFANGTSNNRRATVNINGSNQLTGVSFPSTGAWASWNETNEVTVTLIKGENTIQLIGEIAESLANIDYIEVIGNGISVGTCGEAPPVQNFTLSTGVNGQGSVNPNAGTYEEGTQVSITATPADGWQFENWSGSASGSNNPVSVTMDSNKSVTANFSEIPQEEPPTGGTNVSDGGIYVMTARHSQKVIDVEDCSTGAGTFLKQNSWWDLDCQKWEFVDAGNGYWHIIPNHTSGMMVRARGSSSGSGVSLNSASTTSNDRQWTLNEVENGFYQLRPRNNTNLCLTVNGNSTGDNADVVVSTCNNSALNQQFSFSGEGGQGGNGGEPPVQTYTLNTQINGQGSVNPSTGTFDEGSQVSVSATAANGWQFDSWSGDLSGSANPTSLTMNSNKNITANFSQIPSNGGGDVEIVGSYVTTKLISVDIDERAFYMLVNRSNGKVMDVQGRSILNDANIVTANADFAMHQVWRMDDMGNGIFNLANGHSDKVVRHRDGNVRQERNGSSNNHRWRIIHESGTYFRLENVGSSNTVMAVSGDNVVGAAPNGSAAQQWEILRVTAAPIVPDFKLQGFATVGQGTTGGAGGSTVTVNNANDLIYYMQHQDPYVILIQGTITLGAGDHHSPQHNMHSIAPNKTLFGMPGATIKGGGFNIRGTRNDGIGEVTRSNIIIRNLIFDGPAPDDFINIEWGASHVWVDHNTFNGPNSDGIIDVKRESSFVTISWNVINTNHKTMLLGHDASHTHDRGFLKVTYHHNFIHDSQSRHPRMRYGRAHLFNNYFKNIGDYVMGPGIEAEIVSENNHVWTSGRFTDWYHDTGKVLERGQGSLINRIGHDHDPRIVTSNITWGPEDYYSYTLYPALSVRDMVQQFSGAGVITYDANTMGGSNLKNASGQFVFEDEATNKKVSVFPNPVKDNTLYVNLDGFEGETAIKLFDMSGRLMLQQKSVDESTIAVNFNGNSGVYILQIINGEEVFVERVAVDK